MKANIINNPEKIGIVTDSTCDLPEPLLAQYGITVIPQVVVWGEQTYHDRVDLQPEEFYRRLESEAVRPRSSMPSLAEFLEAYDRVATRGVQELVVLTVSGAMSGTFEMARTAARQFSLPVTVWDSKGPTMTLGWQVLAAARARTAGADRDAILAELATVRSRMVQCVAMETLEYLETGGRIGAAARWAGTLLHVKPLVSINHQTGLVEPISLARTHSALMEQFYHKFFEKVGSRKNLHVAVLHGNAPERAKELAERIRAEFHPVELLTNITGPVLGINTGPGALALCGYSE